LILQPLIENAIRHGIAKKLSRGFIQIRAAKENGNLVIQIKDNGPGLSIDSRAILKEGIGLANTRKRLSRLYDNHYEFNLEKTRNAGMNATIKIPFHINPLKHSKNIEA